MLGGIVIVAAGGLWCSPAAADSPGFVVAPGAVDVLRVSGEAGTSLSYLVPEPFPAARTLAFIRRRLEQLGWRPTTEEDRFPRERSSFESGWFEEPGKRVRVAARAWYGRWIDSTGAEVVYTLEYRSPQAEDGMTSTHVSVIAWYRDGVQAAVIRAQARELKARHRRVP